MAQQLSVQEILNRVCDNNNDRMITTVSATAERPSPQITEQQFWNKVYNSTTNLIRIN